MKKSTLSLLLTALLAATGIAQAQSTMSTTPMTKDAIRQDAQGQNRATANTDVPSKAGEASTMTKGKPNAATTNQAASDTPAMTKGEVRNDAKGRGGASATSSLPGGAGEASTMVNGRPNAIVNDAANNRSGEQKMTYRETRKAERDARKAEREAARQTSVMGQKGAQSGASAGTPHNTPAGTPSVKDGGTAK